MRATRERVRKLIDVFEIGFGAAEADGAEPPRKRAQIGRVLRPRRNHCGGGNSLNHALPVLIAETKMPWRRRFTAWDSSIDALSWFRWHPSSSPERPRGRET
jgi:hypothetical protein